MELKSIAAALNILSYPEQMDTVIPSAHADCICDPCWVDSLEQKYQVFGQYHDIVRRAAQELQYDHERLYWGKVSATYFAKCSVPEARMIPMPASNGTLAGDFLPLMILMTQLDNSVEEYRRRGMPEDMIRRNLDHFIDGISIVENRIGRPAIDQTYFKWLCKFIKATLYNHRGFNFEIRELPGHACFLQKIDDKSIIPVMLGEYIHQSGLLLGSAGCNDEKGSYFSLFTEHDAYYDAYACKLGKVDPTPRKFPKDQYRIILRSGDPVVSVHIPRGTNISRKYAASSLKSGFQAACQFYPEHQAKALYCRSWLLDPTFRTLLKPTAKIPEFGELFTRYPAKSIGNEVFSFVFRHSMPLEDLPETTSLERALKRHYLSGKFISAYSGIALPELL